VEELLFTVFKLHNVTDIRQIEAELPVPGASYFEFEIAIAKLKTYNFPGSFQNLEELIQAGFKILLFEIHKLMNSV
jgi:hypothetical protein